MDMYLRMSWKDYRLRHPYDFKVLNTQDSIKNIWLPDIYFVNARLASFQRVTVPNFSVFIRSDGTVSYSTRVILDLACNLDLSEYPMDRQTCYVKIMSYAHSESEMIVRWFDSRNISFNPNIDLPEFKLTAVTPHYCKGTFAYAITEDNYETGNFSCLRANLHLVRSLGYHLVQTYVPTGLNVFISWVSFWIDATAVPARVSLSFTTLLTLTTQGAGIRYSLPPVSYAKAIDYWFGMCMLFVFAALIEFAFVNSLMRRSKKTVEMKPKTIASAINTNDGESDGSNIFEENPEAKAKRMARKGVCIDKTCRWAFPAAFFSFNIFYWTYYLVS